ETIRSDDNITNDFVVDMWTLAKNTEKELGPTLSRGYSIEKDNSI
ncbi:hypothetical protein CEXT_754351, partial [Caerostris extrusa]